MNGCSCALHYCYDEWGGSLRYRVSMNCCSCSLHDSRHRKTDAGSLTQWTVVHTSITTLVLGFELDVCSKSLNERLFMLSSLHLEAIQTFYGIRSQWTNVHALFTTVMEYNKSNPSFKSQWTIVHALITTQHTGHTWVIGKKSLNERLFMLLSLLRCSEKKTSLQNWSQWTAVHALITTTDSEIEF